MEKTCRIQNNKLKQKHVCPFCNSHNVVGNGIYKERKRYRCKDCKKSYNDLTGTVYSHIQDIEKFNQYTKSMMLGKTIRETAEELKISPNTSFLWKKRLLKNLSEINKFHQN